MAGGITTQIGYHPGTARRELARYLTTRSVASTKGQPRTTARAPSGSRRRGGDVMPHQFTELLTGMAAIIVLLHSASEYRPTERERP